MDVFATGGELGGSSDLDGPWQADRVFCHSFAGHFPVDARVSTVLLAARCRAPSGRACRLAYALDMGHLDAAGVRAGSRHSVEGGLHPSSGNRPGRVTGSQANEDFSHHLGPRKACTDPAAEFSASALRRVELEIGATRLFRIDGCGPHGSCSNVRFVATTETEGGAGLLSWLIAQSEGEQRRAAAGDLRGFAVGREAWTRSATTCALESKGLVSPREAGDSFHLVLRCDHSSPVPCVVDVAVSAVSLEASRLPVAMRSGVRASVEASQVRTVTAVQDPPTIARLFSGEWLAIPIGGCDAEACSVSIAAFSLACRGQATVVVQSSQQEDVDAFDLEAAATTRTLETGGLLELARVLVRCSGDEDDHCHFAVGVAWRGAGPSAALRDAVAVLEARRGAGVKCTAATQCHSGGCRGGVCCLASEGSASSDCVACQTGTGVCVLRAGDLVVPPVNACSGPEVDAFCGTARGGGSFRCSQTGSPLLPPRTTGACLCGDAIQLWGTGAGHQPVPVCSERVALLRNSSASAAAVFAALQSKLGEPARPSDDGGFAIAMGVVTGTVALAGVAVVLLRHRGTPHDEPMPAEVREAPNAVALPLSPKPKSFGSIDPFAGHPPIMEVEESEDDDCDSVGEGAAGDDSAGTPHRFAVARCSGSRSSSRSHVVQVLDTSMQPAREEGRSPSVLSRVLAKRRASSMWAACPPRHCAIQVLDALRQAQRGSSAGNANALC